MRPRRAQSRVRQRSRKIGARDEAKDAQIQAVLKSLLLELHRNRLAALAQEHRLVVSGPGQQVPAFSTRMADALAAGALWALTDVDSMLDLVAQAYEHTADLARAVSPMRWLPLVLSGFGVAAVTSEDAGFRWRWQRRRGYRPSRRSIVYALTGLALVGVARADSYAFSSGLATRARASIEPAMAAIYRRLNHAAEIDWAKYDARLDARFRVLPPRTPTLFEKALALFGGGRASSSNFERVGAGMGPAVSHFAVEVETAITSYGVDLCKTSASHLAVTG